VVSPSTFHETILPFLREADAHNERVVVHCSAGCGRTGHVLALWLVTDRDYTLSEAIETVETVEQTDRQPKEAASRAELEDVLQHASGLSS
jgi:protein-tyrosine phosphatase